MPAPNIFDSTQGLIRSGSIDAALQNLTNHLEEQGRVHELFEALKLQLRHRLGISPAQTASTERLDDATEEALEKGLIDACRQVGATAVAQGQLREAWMYLRPVGDREAAASLFATVEPTDENTDALIEILVHEAVDVPRGYALALERLGTCNSITLFEQALSARPRSDQQQAVGLLIEHVYNELWKNLKYDLEQKEGQPPSESTLQAVLAARPNFLRDGTYHLDTSHIASTVRFARVVDDPALLHKALDLAYYGRQLHRQYQLPGDEPFLDLYPASIAFFEAILGREAERGIRYFTHKADSVDRQQFGYIAVEILVDLLARCGQPERAIDEFRRRIPADVRTMGIAPSLLQLSERLGDYQSMLEICETRQDLISYTAALLMEQRTAQP